MTMERSVAFFWFEGQEIRSCIEISKIRELL